MAKQAMNYYLSGEDTSATFIQDSRHKIVNELTESESKIIVENFAVRNQILAAWAEFAEKKSFIISFIIKNLPIEGGEGDLTLRYRLTKQPEQNTILIEQEILENPNQFKPLIEIEGEANRIADVLETLIQYYEKKE